MQRKNKSAAALAFLVLSISISGAIATDGSEVIRKMWREQASMWDVGLPRLEEHLESAWTGRRGITGTLVDVTEDLNKVVIRLFFKPGLFSDPKKQCFEIIGAFRESEYIINSKRTGSLSPVFTPTIVEFFMHQHFDRPGYELDSSGEMDINFIEAVVNLFIIEAVEVEGDVICSGPWNGSEITFRDTMQF